MTAPGDLAASGSSGDAAPARFSKRRRAGLIGAVVGVAAAGIAAGVAVERIVVRRARNAPDDPYAGEPFGRLPYDETRTVTTADGVDLHVEITEPAVELDEPTLVFVHGFCLDQGTFHFQRKALDELGRHRMVFFDQPGHGLSGRLSSGEYELPALGDALLDVINATIPAGPIVLIGHSMGGMAVIAAAERHPALFAERVAGVVLISTSAGQLEGAPYYGVPELIGRAGGPLMNVASTASRMTGGVIDKARQAGTDLAWLLTRRYAFGNDKPSPALVSYVETMNSRTPTDTVARYLRTIYSHARYPALRTLAGLPVLLICGAKDAITPLEHTREISQLLPHAELLVVPDSGHVVLLEHSDPVNDAILDFLSRQ